MFLFSRYKAPWVGFVFIAVVAVGALMRFQLSSEEEAQRMAQDKVGFEEFKKDLAPLKLSDKVLNSTSLFELYRCGVLSVTEGNYCNRIAESFFESLTEDQKKELAPIIDKHFNHRK